MTPDRIGKPVIHDESCRAFYYLEDHGDGQQPTHVALSLDPQKRVELREAVLRVIKDNVYATVEYHNGDDIAVIDDEEFDDAADAVLAVLLGSGGES